VQNTAAKKMGTDGQSLQFPAGDAWLVYNQASMALSGLPSFLLQGIKFSTHSIIGFLFYDSRALNL
jgi:hypothetical protein